MPEVSSGDLTGNVVGDGSDEAAYLNWQLASQDVEGNFSIINWQVGWYFVDLSCRGLRKGYANINGSYVYYDFEAGDHIHAFNGSHDHRPSLEIASGSVQLNHGETGGCTFGAAVTMTGFNNQKSSGSASWDLPSLAPVPNAPSKPILTSIAQTSMRVTFEVAEDGPAIDSKQLGYGTNPTTPDTIISALGDDSISGLLPATTYYVFARTHNAAGYSAWSSPLEARTIAGARVKVGVLWKEAIPYIRTGGVWKVARPYVRVEGVWKEGL